MNLKFVFLRKIDNKKTVTTIEVRHRLLLVIFSLIPIAYKYHQHGEDASDNQMRHQGLL